MIPLRVYLVGDAWRFLMNLNRRNFFLILPFFIAMLLLGLAWFLLSKQTFYASLVLDRVKDALEEAGGYSLAVASLEGNPVTGVYGENVSIVHGDVEIAEAKRIDLHLLVSSLFTSSPKLKSLLLEGVSGDYSVISKHLPKSEQDRSSGPPALDRLILREANLWTPWGMLNIAKADLRIAENSYEGSFGGKFRDRPLRGKASVNFLSEMILFSNFNIEWDDMELKGTGTVSPDLDLHVAFRSVDTDKIVALIPAVADSDVKGVFDGKLHVMKETSYDVSGEITSSHGIFSEFPFKSLETDITYRNDNLTLAGLRVSFFDSPLSGRVSIAFKKTSPLLSLVLEAKSIDTKKLAKKFKWLKDFPGTIDLVSCDLSGPPNSLSGLVDLQTKVFTIADFDCKEIHAAMKVKKSASIAVDFETFVLASSLAGSGDITLSPDVNLNVNLTIPTLSLASLGKKYPEIEKFALSGSGSSKVNIRGPSSNLAYTVRAFFPTLVVSKDHTLHEAKGEFIFSQDGFFLKKALAKWNGAVVTASGNAKEPRPSTARELDFKGNIETLSLSTLKEAFPSIGENKITGVLRGTWALRGTGDDPVIGFDMKVPNLFVGKKLSLSNVRAVGHYRDGAVDLSTLQLNQGNTRIEAGGKISLPTSTSPLTYTLKGAFRNFNFNQLVKMGIVSEDISGDAAGDIRIWKESASPGAFRVFFKEATLRYRNLLLSKITGALALVGEKVSFENLRTNLGSGSIRVNGTVDNVFERQTANAAKDVQPKKLELNVVVTSADVGRTIRLFSPETRGFQGLMTLNARIEGTPEDPSFTGGGSLFGVRALGLFLQKITFENVSGNKDLIKLPKIQASVERGIIDGSGRVFRKDREWRGAFKAGGKNVDIKRLTFSLDDETRKGINGRLDFDFEGKGSMKAFEGRGKVRMPILSLRGLRFTDVQAPFWVSDGFVVVEESTAKAYGGRVTAQIAKDLRLTRWGGRVEISSADFAPVLRDLMPDSKGSISGKLNMKMKMEGDSGRTSMRDGSGSFEITDGEIRGFAGAKAVSKLIGGRALRFNSALASYNVDGKALYLLPGSRVSAPKGDPVFKYVMIDGSITMDKKLDLSCLGNVNIRALNAFAGGIQGLLSAAMENREGMFQDFLSGAISGAIGGAIAGLSKKEFRDVRLVVRGTSGDIRFENIRIAAPPKTETLPDGLLGPRETKDRDSGLFRINFEFPVGPGTGKEVSGDGK